MSYYKAATALISPPPRVLPLPVSPQPVPRLQCQCCLEFTQIIWDLLEGPKITSMGEWLLHNCDSYMEVGSLGCQLLMKLPIKKCSQAMLAQYQSVKRSI